MKKLKIGVFDSGIGGLVPLKKLSNAILGADFFYVGDNLNAPYGEKSDREILNLSLNSLSLLLSNDLDCVLIGCNTVSAILYEKLKSYSTVPLFAVFPPCESSVLLGKTLLLGTPRTTEKYRNIPRLTSAPMPNLAKEVEHNILNKKKINLDYHFKNFQFIHGEYTSVILGCTHYELIKTEIANHLKPLNIFSGTENAVKKIKKCFSIEKCEKNAKNTFIFLGKSASYNQKVFNRVVELNLDI